MNKTTCHIVSILGIALLLMAASCKKEPASTVNPTSETGKKVFYAWDKFCMGADLSYVNEVEDFGGIYKDSAAAKDI